MNGDNVAGFRAVLRRASRLRTGEPIPSSTPDQAALVLETFFASANSSVRIVTGRLNARIYGRDPVIIEAKKFLADRNRVLEIIFLSEVRPRIVDVHPLLASLRYNDNVRLFHASKLAHDTFLFHFCVADSDAYRLKREPDSHASITAFGDEAFASKLIEVFALLRENSTEINLAQAEMA